MLRRTGGAVAGRCRVAARRGGGLRVLWRAGGEHGEGLAAALAGSDGASHRPLRTITAHKGGIRAAVFDRHGRVLATGSDDGIVNLWQFGSWDLLKTLDFSGDLSICLSLAFSPGQDVLGYGGDRPSALIDIANERSAIC